MRPPRRAPGDWLRAGEAALYFGVSQIGFVLPPGLLIGRWVARALEEPTHARADAAEEQRLARITRAVSRRWPRENRCLQRSLVLCWLLRRRRLGGRLQVGVRHAADGLVAHAWVIREDSILNDDESRCAAFATLERTDACAAIAARMEYSR
ncbi:MAG: lasso peptide biosynthesis B2 protein [Dehalococcoidia bacterium]